MSIKAPFNFVPLNDKVFYPDWANAISQDVPFEDGQSGTITLNITADSPIFVRNGSLSEDKKEENFSQWQESKDSKPKYFIPGSSVKGMLRSVLEILSFGKLGIYDDNRYAVRDLSSATNFYMTKMKNVQCGFLINTKEGYKIIDCGEPRRVSHEEIDKKFKTNMAAYFRGEKTTIADRYDEAEDMYKSARHKHDLFPIVVSEKVAFTVQREIENAKRLICTFNGSDEEGEIVFTGQPSRRINPKPPRKSSGKFYEFVFVKNNNAAQLNVEPKVMKDFKFAYFDHEKATKQSIDWQHWKTELDNNKDVRIPVFFQKDTKGNVLHFGLSYLYKLPYENSVGDIVNKMQKNTKANALDLAECIFGCIEDDYKNGTMLKGRVHFGHAFANPETVRLADRATAILNSPKASYYPLYLTQNINTNGVLNNGYKTFMNDDAKIAGRKRYPIHDKFIEGLSSPQDGQENVSVKFVPLQQGAKFQCQIAYHNLRKAELGALLSAITFHNTADCFHSIGMAKPLGYGKIKVEAKITPSHNSPEDYLFENALSSFEYMMGQELDGAMKWLRSEQMQELFAMATDSARTQQQLRYMPLADFSTNKTNNFALQSYSQLSGSQKFPATQKFPISQTTGVPTIVNTQKTNIVTLIDELKQALKSKNRLLDSHFLDLENQKQAQIEQDLILADKKQKQEELEQMLQKEAEARRQEQLNVAQNTGLQITADKDFSKMAKQVERYLRNLKTEILPQKDYETLFQALTEGFKLITKPNEKTVWAGKLANPIYLVKWLGAELAKEWATTILQTDVQ